MKNKAKKQTPQKHKPLVEKEELEKLINEELTQEEVENLKKEGFTIEQIAYVAKERVEFDKLTRNFDKITYLLTWIFPDVFK